MAIQFGTFKLTEQKMREKFKEMEVKKKFLKKLLAEYDVK